MTKTSVNSPPYGGCPRARGERPVVRQLDNGRAVSNTGRRVRQPLRGTCTHARASTRARAPTVHTPTHIFIALHKHDHSTFFATSAATSPLGTPPSISGFDALRILVLSTCTGSRSSSTTKREFICDKYVPNPPVPIFFRGLRRDVLRREGHGLVARIH